MIPRYLVDFDARELPVFHSDILVVGSGVAGLTAALDLSRDFEVRLITKSGLEETATAQAQGGVATIAAAEDSPTLHLEDTLRAGAGIGNRRAARVLVEEGPERVAELFRLGVRFDWEGETISLAREGGHSRARVLHARDATGEEIQDSLVRAAEIWRSVQLHPNSFALDLLTVQGRCFGLLVFDQSNRQLQLCLSRATILASGGAGQLFAMTTNPQVATGDGLAMAYRAQAELMDLEFIQFHPTAFYQESGQTYLLSEALRGEGAHLVDGQGKRFLEDFPAAELAPRDIVTRKMIEIMRASGTPFVYLDARHLGASFLKERFPSIWKFLADQGLSLASDLIPVAPAAHYIIGGVRTDLWGRTTIKGLCASGEVAATGVHGANRLASNALLEGLVFSKRIARYLRKELGKKRVPRWARVIDSLNSHATAARPISAGGKRIDVADQRRSLQELMTAEMGPVRHGAGLQQALVELDGLEPILRSQLQETSGFELQNMLLLARVITSAALARRESRGVHFREDFPATDDENWKRHQVCRAAASGAPDLDVVQRSASGGGIP